MKMKCPVCGNPDALLQQFDSATASYTVCCKTPHSEYLITPLKEIIKTAVEKLCGELQIFYPGVFIKKFDDAGFPLENGGKLFQERLEMLILIELNKIGAIF